MGAEDSHRVIDLFHEVLEQPPDSRDRYIAERFESDQGLASKLRRLLAGHERAETDRVRTTCVVQSNLDEGGAMPDSVGPYRLLEPLGEGGMGVVYAAEQSEPIRRRVAVKIIRAGMDSRDVMSRFAAERQVLAMLDHPGIAKVFDAGSTAQGRPYFVMELVKGLPLAEYCIKCRLSLRERLSLFVRVCEAVHHAHQRGVIHRDLKPSNVLVASVEGSHAPKVIDFGVAKATASSLSEGTAFTEQGRLIGTPEYMSPEQADMSGLDIDTRTDVYSLGVMLYELITGALPFESETLRSGGYANIRRVIVEVDPPRPSDRLMELARKENKAFSIEGISPKRLRGELDWIVMRAIEKIRSRRYDSANELRDDIERYLTDQPVKAGPPSTAYRLRKYIKRHRVITMVAASALIASAAGVAGLTVGLVNAQQARALADRRADNAQVAADFLQTVLFHVDPEFGGGDLSLNEVIGIASRSIEEDLSGHPEVEASVRESIGVAYRRLSSFESAEPHLRRSLEIRRELLGDEHLQTARSFIAMAYLMFEHEGRIDEALGLLERAERAYEINGLAETPAHAWLMLDVGLINLASDRIGLAEQAFETSMRLLAEQRGAEHHNVSRPLRGLALCALARGELESADRLAREAVRLCAGEGAVYIGARAKLVLARVLIETGGEEQARSLLNQAREQFARTVGPRHVRMAELDACESELLLRDGMHAQALHAAERCLDLRREILHPQHWSLLESELVVLRARIGLGISNAVEERLREIQSIASTQLGDDHPLVISTMRARLESALALGDATLEAVRTDRLDEAAARRSGRLETDQAPARP